MIGKNLLRLPPSGGGTPPPPSEGDFFTDGFEYLAPESYYLNDGIDGFNGWLVVAGNDAEISSTFGHNSTSCLALNGYQNYAKISRTVYGNAGNMTLWAHILNDYLRVTTGAGTYTFSACDWTQLSIPITNGLQTITIESDPDNNSCVQIDDISIPILPVTFGDTADGGNAGWDFIFSSYVAAADAHDPPAIPFVAYDSGYTSGVMFDMSKTVYLRPGPISISIYAQANNYYEDGTGRINLFIDEIYIGSATLPQYADSTFSITVPYMWAGLHKVRISINTDDCDGWYFEMWDLIVPTYSISIPAPATLGFENALIDSKGQTWATWDGGTSFDSITRHSGSNSIYTSDSNYSIGRTFSNLWSGPITFWVKPNNASDGIISSLWIDGSLAATWTDYSTAWTSHSYNNVSYFGHRDVTITIGEETAGSHSNLDDISVPVY